ncbi:MAG: TetR/AcrR family transcriptional regulator [Planctomycetota bacterium]
MSIPSTPNESAAVRRHQRQLSIIEAAARLFAELGYNACEMERVAAEIGVAKGTLYLYFPGKQELFFACVDLGMGQMQQAVLGAAKKADDPFARISLAIRAYLDFFDQHPQYVELIIQERAIFKDRKRPTYFEYREANVGVWRELYRSLIASGHLRSDLPAERILDTVGYLLYGTMFTNHFIGRTVTLEEQYTSMLEIVFRGILSERERSIVTICRPSTCGSDELPHA